MSEPKNKQYYALIGYNNNNIHNTDLFEPNQRIALELELLQNKILLHSIINSKLANKLTEVLCQR